jgi:hypothetical protein
MVKELVGIDLKVQGWNFIRPCVISQVRASSAKQSICSD